MRTKLILSAVAALAVSLASSMAQTYSANVVGYVTLITAANQYAAIENPLNLDGVNSLTNILATAPKGTKVQIWNGAGYNQAARALFGAGAWNVGAETNILSPGVGFFINTPSAWTNTFVGTVIPNRNATNTVVFTGGILYMVGSVLPVSGTITNAADQGTNALNLGATMPKGTKIQIWNGNGYDQYARALFGAGTWSGNPTIQIGQSFFLNPGSTTNWSQTLQ
jgi:hypothetical protein